MLVLTRKPGEQVIIANNIRITVVSVGPGRVKIGIEAPSDVKIDRQEVRDRKQLEGMVPAAVPVVVDGETESPTPTAVLHNRIVDRIPPTPRPLTPRRFPPRKPR